MLADRVDAPDTPDMASDQTLEDALQASARLLDACRRDPDVIRGVDRMVEVMAHTIAVGRSLYVCGNGGSMSDATHFAEELVGRFREDRAALPALAFSDAATLTCIANDYGFDEVFARQVEAHGRAGDLLLCLSTSGESENLVRAAATARERGMTTTALLGRGGGKLAAQVDVAIVVPEAATPDRVQEVHGVLLHAAVEALEKRLRD